ncbi:MAG: LysM peptidoglycan-binding domain-containing protein [Phycisphaerales bacterium]|nr:MAG: LysM peptidoglycan-binding domain-containing protein [Phycisphaerales bacterium]
MTREIKLALIVGSALVLVVGVLISDHMSGARLARIETVAPESVGSPAASEPPRIAINPAPVVPLLDEPEPAPVYSLAMADTEAPSFDANHAEAPLVIDMGVGALGRNDAPRVALNEAPLESVAAFKAWAEQQGVRLVDAPVAANVERRNGPGAASNNNTQRPAPAAPVQRTPAPEPERVHAVVRGDSLWKIAERYYNDGALHARLARHNRDRLGPNGELLADTVLRIPSRSVLTGEAAPAAQPAPAEARPAPARPARTTTYTVARGDTLGEIAQRTLGSSRRWREIVELNKSVIKDPDVVPVGTVLTLPAR